MKNSRRSAAFIITRWLATKDFPASLLPEGPDRAFVQSIVYMVIRRLRALRKILGGFVSKWPKGELEALLYVGAAQILYMDEIPDFAAVNETVEAAKESGNRAIVRVVNGVLRNLIRKRDEIGAMMKQASLEERESFPTEIVRRWRARFDEQDVVKLCEWHNMPAQTYLARRDGSFVMLERGKRVEDVIGFREGDFIVQDPGTRYAVEMVNPQCGDEILDACASPGGKTIQMVWRGANVVACEVNPRRRQRLIENIARVKASSQVEVVPSLELDGRKFAKVLVDAPCSNTGVFRRRPDARWNWSLEKLSSLTKLQAEILDKVAPLVAMNGALIYSTCSNEPEENIKQVEAFLGRHADFSLVDTFESIPYVSGNDGAFTAKLVRKMI